MVLTIAMIIALFSILSPFTYVPAADALGLGIPKALSTISRTKSSFSMTYTSRKPYETKYFTQRLDHFSFHSGSDSHFQQRYLINSSNWFSSKPIFVYTGNEGDIEDFARITGFMFEIAPQFNALVIFIEHRFYGQSMPFNVTAKTIDPRQLAYLNSEQALADFATLIIDVKKNLSAQKSPVIVFGGSYGGLLAAWFRLKYPHIAIGAVASSAPILGFDGLVKNSSYFYDIVSNDYMTQSHSCYEVIKGSWDEIEGYANKPGGLDYLRKKFNVCKNDNMTLDSLKIWLKKAWIYPAMCDYPFPSNLIRPLPAYPIQKICEKINDLSINDTLVKLRQAASVFYNHSGLVSCFDMDEDSTLSDIGWVFQTCTEMIFPMESKKSMFPDKAWDYKIYSEDCKENFEVQPRKHWIITEYGGYHFKRVLKHFASNIIFFNGLKDPWSGAGVLENISDTIVTFVAKEGAHHVDLYRSTSADPAWLKDVRQSEIDVMKKWILEYNQDIFK